MSYHIAQKVTYLDHEGVSHGALVLHADNQKGEATLVIVHRDSKNHALILGADWQHALERLFNVESFSARYNRLAKERQEKADETGTNQPSIALSDFTETFYSHHDSKYSLPGPPISPTPKPVVAEAPQAPAAPASPVAPDSPPPAPSAPHGASGEEGKANGKE